MNSTTTPPCYVYDSDPTVYSRLTLLIYLNDDFEGGCTTFFLPSYSQGVLEARPVKPRTGSVCVFPHGAAKGSLLHEVGETFFSATCHPERLFREVALLRVRNM